MEKMNACGLEIEETEQAIRKGMKWKEHNADKWHANMAGIECVFIKNNDEIFVITVYKNGGSK